VSKHQQKLAALAEAAARVPEEVV
jgi:hypothetical protein